MVQPAPISLIHAKQGAAVFVYPTPFSRIPTPISSILPVPVFAYPCPFSPILPVPVFVHPCTFSFNI